MKVANGYGDGCLFSNMSNIPVRLCYDGTWVQILNLCDIELECVMFGSKRSQEGEAGEKCRNTINDYGSKQYLTPSHVQTVTIPVSLFCWWSA